MTAPKKKGFRLIAYIYENEKAYKADPNQVWGYRFFDETGKKKVLDISHKDLVSTKKKDTFNALSVHCYHSHLVKEGKELRLSFEDGDKDYLPCVSKEDNSILKPSLPIVYEICKDGDEIVAYNVVSPTGSTQTLSIENLKNFILNNLNGKNYIMYNGTLKGYNLKLFLRNGNNKTSSHYVLARTNPEYAFPETKI